MNSHNLGFMSSWKMLTRDKGWIKPVLVLTLVGMIPLVGQIAVLGYALEWARLTAWGIDSAPKQHGVDYGKVISTGLRAFGVTFTMGLVIGLILEIIFPGALVALSQMYTMGGSASVAAMTALGSSFTVIMMVIMMLANSFILAAVMRATLYDSFAAGWRVDRLFQMIARDFGGFFKTFVVVLIGMLIAFAYAFIVTIIAVFVVAGGALGATAVMGLGGGFSYGSSIVADLLTWGAGPLLLLFVLGMGVLFIASVIGTVMNLIAVNAMGQWFCRFEVNRWGQSGDPLPDGVPRKNDSPATPTPVGADQPAQQAAPVYEQPVPPVDEAAAPAAEPAVPVTPDDQAVPAAEPATPVTPVADPAQDVATSEPTAPAAEEREAKEQPAPTTPAPWDAAFAEAGVSAEEVEGKIAQDCEPASPEAEGHCAEDAVKDEQPSGDHDGVELPSIDELWRGSEPSTPTPAGDEASASDALGGELPPSCDPIAEKKPIPLGPITTGDDGCDSGNGPIDA